MADGGTVTVTNGVVPNSNDVTFNSPGTYLLAGSVFGWQEQRGCDKHVYRRTARNCPRSGVTYTGHMYGRRDLRCDLGTIPAGGSVTITLVTTPSALGTQTNTVTVVGNESECHRVFPPPVTG